MEMGEFSKSEIEKAFLEYRRRGVETHDWENWASLFAEDARYVEHFLGEFQGRDAIRNWIVETMAEYPFISLWMDWWVIEDDRVALYIWNNLPDPTGDGKRYAFPNSTVLRYAGNGEWDYEEDFYNPADAERVWAEWFNDGGRLDTEMDRNLKGVEGWAPPVPEPAFSREEVKREFFEYRRKGDIAVATGDWDQWANQFTDDAQYFEHNYGRFSGREEIRSWISQAVKPFPEMYFALDHYMIDGNRVVAVIPNCLPDPKGGRENYSFNVHVVLHYAGEGMWSYEEDVYNPREAEEVVSAWMEAGGTPSPRG